MNYTIDYKISGKFLRAEVSGEYPISKFYEVTENIDKVIDDNSIDKILVDLRNFKQRYGVFDGLQSIENFREESKLLQFAVLDRIENKQNNDFYENASFNRGYKLLFFYKEAEALSWLDVVDNKVYEKTLQQSY
ncbi:MAG: hypothetical protein IT280_08520 [Ignavibacteria bacterium]|nr:hypothetical protein [Ignavibacteria bacterium]